MSAAPRSGESTPEAVESTRDRPHATGLEAKVAEQQGDAAAVETPVSDSRGRTQDLVRLAIIVAAEGAWLLTLGYLACRLLVHYAL